ncbi:MAG: insulinase family protein [Pyrinomonadaceae bacterium]|nr:insulinase family protein [Pyrinomonadaceae bacterium]
MIFKRTLFILFIFVTVMTTTTFAQKGDKLPPIKYTEMKLPNGLRVIMHQDKSTPIVAVNLWYHVGSKNEVVGRTGFAHLFEHMMFQGSKNYDADYFTPLQEAGATINGSTNPDRTNYFEVVPSNFLELALFMEADRLGGLLEAMTQEKLDNQRDVVKNERRQRYDNQPYGTAFEKIFAQVFPKEHPYNWTTIGSLEDLSAASQDDVKAFFRQYYVPNNASLVIAGDFDEKQAKVWVEKYFGSIAKGADIKRPTPAMPKMSGETRKTYEDAVQLSRLYMVWNAVPQYSADEAALDMLGSILSAGRGSRLQKNLVYDKQIAQDAGAFNYALEAAGMMIVQSSAKPGKTLDDIEKEINLEIERLKNEPPTAEEMTRALNSIESNSIFGLQNVLGKADTMNSYATYVGKPDYFQADLDRYRKVTAADVQRVAKTYLTKDRFVMSFVPRGKTDATKMDAAVNRPTSAPAKKDAKKDVSAQTANLPKPGADPKFSLPPIEKQKLSNGLEVWMVKQSELPIVSMNLVLKSGGTLDPSDKSGVAAMTASLLDDGTKTRTADEIANQLQAIGASVGAGSGWDSANVSMSSLTKNVDQALDIFADITLNPTFPDAELEKYRSRLLTSFVQRKALPNAISDLVYNKLLYGKNHPYSKQLSGDEVSVKGIKRDDLVGFYETNYRPNNAVLIVVGDVDGKTLMPKLEKSFGAWKKGDVKLNDVGEAPMLDKPGIYIVDKPGAAQSVVAIGQVGVARSNPDFFPLQVMNSMLGGQFSSRINLNLREDKGYTYGARTGYAFRRGAGPFTASADVQTAVTKESVFEFLKELRGIRGEIPVTAKELDYNKQSLIRRYPQGFETVGQISGQLSSLIIYNLPDSYFSEFIPKVNAVTVEDVNRVANKYLTPDKMAILVVGDRKVIEPKLKELGMPVMFLDSEGSPIE